MALYSIKEFAELTGKEPKDIHTYAGRGKVIKNDDRMIDTSNPVNDLFVKLNCSNTTDTENEPKPTPKTTKRTSKTKASTTKKESTKQSKPNELTDLEIQKKRLEVEKLQKDNMIKDEELKKTRGQTIELDKAVAIVGAYVDTMKKEYSQQIQVLIQDICSRHNISTDKAGEYKLKVNGIVNKSSEKGVEVVKMLN